MDTVPAAIIASALIGFFAAWITGLINRRCIEITYLTNQICETIEQYSSSAVNYWSRKQESEDTHRILHDQIVTHFHSMNLQFRYLNEHLKAYTYPWWKLELNKQSNQNISEIKMMLLSLHSIASGGDFSPKSTNTVDYDLCRRITSDAEKLKFAIRSLRQRY